MNSPARIGRSSPLGSTITEGGANFSLFSRCATDVDLLFFDSEDDARPERIVSLANAYWESLDFELPKLRDSSGARWRRWIDTSLDTPKQKER
jgi:pullulanase/glycogen debranching enzyme